jgi:hypothetical protein
MSKHEVTMYGEPYCTEEDFDKVLAERDRFKAALERIADGQDGTGVRVHGSGYPDNVQRLARTVLQEATDDQG